MSGMSRERLGSENYGDSMVSLSNRSKARERSNTTVTDKGRRRLGGTGTGTTVGPNAPDPTLNHMGASRTLGTTGTMIRGNGIANMEAISKSEGWSKTVSEYRSRQRKGKE